MTILVDASLNCNFNCRYCYNSLKRGRNFKPDLEAIKKGIKFAVDSKYSNQVVLHGGEPLSWGKEVVEELLKYIKELGVGAGIQSNGYLIDADYISMFKKYGVAIGVSIDGYHPLNMLRCGRDETERIVDNIHWLVDEKIPVGLISVAHKYNALPKYYDDFKHFISDMYSLKITGRINPCLHTSRDIVLTVEEAKAFYLEMAKFTIENGIGGYSPFHDIINSLTGKPDVTCTFRNCDPYSTQGGVIIAHNGRLSVCDKFGNTYYERDFNVSGVRFQILSQTDCKNCRYLYNCMGGCSANAIDNDWRNKDRWCEVYHALFELYEKQLVAMGIPVLLGEIAIPKEMYCQPHGDHWEAIRDGRTNSC